MAEDRAFYFVFFLIFRSCVMTYEETIVTRGAVSVEDTNE